MSFSVNNKNNLNISSNNVNNDNNTNIGDRINQNYFKYQNSNNINYNN